MFLSRYLRHKGFVDGFAGFVFALFSGLHFPVAFIKYWEKRYERKKPIRPYERQDRNRRLFPFDPNELSKEEALELGFGAHAASSLMHFLAKGGRIKYKSDLKKIYGMNDKIYKRLEPYITLDTEEQYLAMNKYLTENPRKKYPYDKKQYANNANKAYKHYDYTNNYKHDSLFKQKK